MNRDDGVAAATVFVWVVGAITSQRWGIWFGVGSVACVLAVVLLLLDPVGLRRSFRPGGLALGVGALAGVVMTGVTYLVYPVVAARWPDFVRATRDLYAEFHALSPAQAALALGPIILGEEVAWRGVVQGALARRLGAGAGAVVGALVYALAHAPTGSPLLVFVAFVCGLYWGLLRAATGSLWAPLVAHLMWDVSVLPLWPLAG